METTNSILLVPVSYSNAKEFSEAINKTTFKNITQLTEKFSELVKDDDEDDSETVELMELDEFIMKVNDSSLNVENFFLSNIFFKRI